MLLPSAGSVPLLLLKPPPPLLLLQLLQEQQMAVILSSRACWRGPIWHEPQTAQTRPGVS